MTATDAQRFFAKAQEGLADARAAFDAGWYTICVRNAYYAAYHAAIAALIAEGIVDQRGGRWAHDFVQAAFVQQLVNRRKVYPASVRSPLPEMMRLRIEADYTPRHISEREANWAVRHSQGSVDVIGRQLGSNHSR